MQSELIHCTKRDEEAPWSMPKRIEITVTSKVSRHNPQFSSLVTMPLDKIEPGKLTGTTAVEGTITIPIWAHAV
jgi:hypothetical protein